MLHTPLMPLGAHPSRRRTRSHCERPFSPWRPSTTTFTRTSLVLISSTLIPVGGQGLEHAAGHRGVALHAHAENRELRHPRTTGRRRAAEQLGLLGGHREAFLQVLLRHGEGDVGVPLRGPRSARSCRPPRPPRRSRSNTWAARPGISGSPTTVTRACDSSRLISSIDECLHLLHAGDDLVVVAARGGAAPVAAARPPAGSCRAGTPRGRSAGPRRRIAGHQHRDLDLAGGDHENVDPLLGQGAEHPLGHAGLAWPCPGRRSEIFDTSSS